MRAPCSNRLKYGTAFDFNGGKPKDKGAAHQQRFGEGHYAARAMNEAAAPLFADATRWATLDGYAVTLPRPDGMRDTLHPGPGLFAPMHAHLLELAFARYCPAQRRAMHRALRRTVGEKSL